jgi:hypothetical protein
MAGFILGGVLALIFISLAMRGPRAQSRTLGTLGAASPAPARRASSTWTWLPPIVLIVAGVGDRVVAARGVGLSRLAGLRARRIR